MTDEEKLLLMFRAAYDVDGGRVVYDDESFEAVGVELTKDGYVVMSATKADIVFELLFDYMTRDLKAPTNS
jgi:hypothetical protein